MSSFPYTPHKRRPRPAAPGGFWLALMLLVSPACSAPVAQSQLAVDPAIRNAVNIDAHGFVIHGQRRILLAGSVQYQRIDRGDWDRALTLFERSGFNTVDVYVPWNYHEPVEGQFDFHTGNHDLAAYLRLCQQHHLNVILRPGPYICDEWDGGGLPAWLYTKPGLELRQNNAPYLSYVRQYLHHVDQVAKPILATNGGPVILYQIENELDFFWASHDRAGYMTALRDMVRADGINVPIVACIGNGNHVTNATGDVSGVFPTDNLYVQHEIEDLARKAAEANWTHVTPAGEGMEQVPLYVSETDRSPLVLRRLLAGGAKGVSPFNFAGGINWGRRNGVTNWAGNSPVATAVDFGGMIGFDMQPRPRWWEAQRLARAVNTFSTLMAESDSVESAPNTFTVSNPALGAENRKGGPGGLFELQHGDSRLIFLLNNTGDPQQTTVTCGNQTFPTKGTLTVAPRTDPIIPFHISLDPWGIPARLDYASAEVRSIDKIKNGIRLTLGAPRDSGIEVAVESEPPGAPGGSSHAMLDLGPGGNRSGTLSLSHGIRIEVQVQNDDPIPNPTNPPAIVINAWGSTDLSPGLSPKRGEVPVTPASVVATPSVIAPTSSALSPKRGEVPVTPAADLSPGLSPKRGEGAVTPASVIHPSSFILHPSLEASGILLGAGWYRTRFTAPDTASYSTLRFGSVSGFATVYLNGVCLGVQRGVGNALEFPVGTALKTGANNLLVRVEIWGHANFDNRNTPANRLGSLRGLLAPVSLEGKASLPLPGPWEVTPDDLDKEAMAAAVRPAASPGPAGSTPVSAGQFRLLSAPLPQSAEQSAGGVDVDLTGQDLLGQMYLNGRLVGRFILGPAMDVQVVGGPQKQLYIPPAWLRPGGRLQVIIEGTSATGALNEVDLTPLSAKMP
ncbi:MAG TPA: beta-galactosidase [Armatimonadota bacterium]|nr:beta-galactosidase [Armatimonadota bacterium]